MIFNVMMIVMKTKEKNEVDFEHQSYYQGLSYSFSNEWNFKEFENDKFIVPWQMEKTKKNEILV